MFLLNVRNLVPAAGALAALALCACGTASETVMGLDGAEDNTSPTPCSIAESPAAPVAPANQKSLSAELAALEALPAPAGMDPELFAGLKDSMAGLLNGLYREDGSLRETGRRLSALPPEEMNRAWCLHGRAAGGDVTVYWRGRHTGDYDLNGEVNVADITPLGAHYGSTTEHDADGLPIIDGLNELRFHVDGDENGEVSISDLTPIGVNFWSRHAGYRVYTGTSTNGTSFTWSATFVPNPQEPGSNVTVPFNSSTAPGKVNHYSVSFPRPPVPDGRQLYVRIMSFDGTTEGLEKIMVVPDGPHAMFDCVTCHRVTDLEFLGTETSCYKCHGAPPEDKQTTWADPPGMHSSCMMCHESHGFAIDTAYTVCSQCHSSTALAATAAHMPDCLGCHATPHLPVAQPVPDDCKACHTAPYEQPDAQWDNAPGNHAECNQCHDEHGFAIATAHTVCSSCHSTIAVEVAAASMPDCMSCHATPHIPSTQVSPDDCIGCHPNPPDKLAADWSQAPGNHGECSQCHQQHAFALEFSVAVCSGCHEALISGGHAGGSVECLDCHDSVHVPETSASGLDCVDCHTNPPEDPAADWTDAPGNHAMCQLCHTEAEHGWKPEPPESVCGDCHGELIDEGHAGASTDCLGCHQYPHLPVNPGDLHESHYHEYGLQCMDCHLGHMTMPDRDTCMVCHEDKTDHNPDQLCQHCHIG